MTRRRFTAAAGCLLTWCARCRCYTGHRHEHARRGCFR